MLTVFWFELHAMAIKSRVMLSNMTVEEMSMRIHLHNDLVAHETCNHERFANSHRASHDRQVEEGQCPSHQITTSPLTQIV